MASRLRGYRIDIWQVALVVLVVVLLLLLLLLLLTSVSGVMLPRHRCY
jgi:hypothetical protein